MFEHLEPYAGDPILTLNEAFQADPRPGKVNLSIGIYFDDAGRMPVLDSVREAETADAGRIGHQALPADRGRRGDYRQAVQALLFGADAAAADRDGRVATHPDLGGPAASRSAPTSSSAGLPQAQVWVSDPTWDNHRAMFEGAGFTVNTYPYYDAGHRRPALRRHAATRCRGAAGARASCCCTPAATTPPAWT
jgi:aromatic-amino-acid transaminase